jgi:hypothetical protein
MIHEASLKGHNIIQEGWYSFQGKQEEQEEAINGWELKLGRKRRREWRWGKRIWWGRNGSLDQEVWQIHEQKKTFQGRQEVKNKIKESVLQLWKEWALHCSMSIWEEGKRWCWEEEEGEELQEELKVLQEEVLWTSSHWTRMRVKWWELWIRKQ